MAIVRLDEILKLMIDWEKKLNDFYSRIHDQLKNERSKKMVDVLKTEQAKAVYALEKLDLKEYKNSEFTKYAPDWRNEDVIPRVDISVQATPAEILDCVLGYEEKLEDYYKSIRGLLVYAKDKEVLDLLIQFKLNQIKRIKGYMDTYDLVF